MQRAGVWDLEDLEWDMVTLPLQIQRVVVVALVQEHPTQPVV